MEEHIGGGRSGQVYLLEQDGKQIARKVFSGDRLGKMVHYLFFGAPNPYTWNRDAIQSARLRRLILTELVKDWMGERLEVSTAFGASWNREARAWQLDTKFLPGRPPLLLHPRRPVLDEAEQLIREVMEPLQQRLREFGFDGLVWQAGRGNPVAMNNFLLMNGGEAPRFALIDLESGVPALFPLNPLALLLFYLPKSLRYRRALFDDVDCRKLRKQLQAEGLDGHPLTGWVNDLETHQRKWKRMPWRERGLRYQLSQGQLTEAQANWFRQRPVRWYWREAKRATVKIARLIFYRIPRKALQKIRSLRPLQFLRRGWELTRSVEARSELAREYVTERLAVWRDRGQMRQEDHDAFLEDLETDEVSTYMGDFGAHLGLKATAQLVEALVLSALFAAGWIGGTVVAIVILADGLIYRTSYTLYRSLQAAARLRPLPWVALGVGVFPLIGTLAYPAQMIWSAAGEKDDLARFIVYDTFTRIGTSLPIWGGEDTRTEHFFNRLAHRIAGRR
jgi:hypothetical protein